MTRSSVSALTWGCVIARHVGPVVQCQLKEIMSLRRALVILPDDFVLSSLQVFKDASILKHADKNVGLSLLVVFGSFSGAGW